MKFFLFFLVLIGFNIFVHGRVVRALPRDFKRTMILLSIWIIPVPFIGGIFALIGLPKSSNQVSADSQGNQSDQQLSDDATNMETVVNPEDRIDSVNRQLPQQAIDFNKLKEEFRHQFSLDLHFVRDPRFGLIVGIPSGWEDNCNQDFFQFSKTDSNSYLTASMYVIEGLPLDAWAKIRFQTVQEKMPYLNMVGEPHHVSGQNWIGIASEYEGFYPDNTYPSHYLVLCLCRGKNLISFTITAPISEYELNLEMYDWIIQHGLILENVIG